MFAGKLFSDFPKSTLWWWQWFSELIATYGLVLLIFPFVVRFKKEAVATAVGLYITAAYWFTASTSFANPAVTIARAFSDSFAGIEPASVVPFILMQLVGAALAWVTANALK